MGSRGINLADRLIRQVAGRGFYRRAGGFIRRYGNSGPRLKRETFAGRLQPAILQTMFLGGIGVLKLLQTFWGLAVLLGLGGYSLYQVAQPSDSGAESTSRDARLEVAQLLPNQTPTPYSTPIGGYPTPSPMTVFLACDGTEGDAVRYYVSAPGGYVVLRVDVDRDAIVALLKGEPTRFGANLNLVQTPCVRGHIRAGRLP